MRSTNSEGTLLSGTREPTRPTTIASVDKALAVIEHMLTIDGGGATLSALTQGTGLNKSSLHHILATLRQRHWIEQDDSGKYHLGTITARMATWWTSSDQAATRLHPVLQQISLETRELVHLGRLYERDVVYLDKVEPDRPIRVWSRIGQSAPVATTAMGRAILGARNPSNAELDMWLKLIDDPSDYLANRLREEIHRVATQGYAVEIGEDRPSLACVGVPLCVVGVPILAVSVTMPVERAEQLDLADIASIIRARIEGAGLEDITLPEIEQPEDAPAVTGTATSTRAQKTQKKRSR